MYITLGFKHHSEALVRFFDRIVHVWHEYVFSVCPSGKKESRLTSDFLTHKCELGFIVRTWHRIPCIQRLGQSVRFLRHTVWALDHRKPIIFRWCTMPHKGDVVDWRETFSRINANYGFSARTWQRIPCIQRLGQSVRVLRHTVWAWDHRKTKNLQLLHHASPRRCNGHSGDSHPNGIRLPSDRTRGHTPQWLVPPMALLAATP